MIIEFFLAGIGLGAVLFAVGYALLWIAVIVSFCCSVVWEKLTGWPAEVET